MSREGSRGEHWTILPVKDAIVFSDFFGTFETRIGYILGSEEST
jgi:hypothetical protein